MADAPKLCGNAIQGGILYGEIETHDVFSSDKKMSNGNVFTIGLPMDAAEIISVKFCDKKTGKSCREFDYKIKQREYREQQVSVPSKFISYPDEIQKRIDSENGKIRAARNAKTAGVFFMDMTAPLPLDKHKITGIFGSRRVFNGKPKSPHNGLDLAAPIGTKISAPAGGNVVLTGDYYMTGKTIFIDHGNRVLSAYFHLNDIYVSQGAAVAGGDIIGAVGNTGRSSGPHLHFGIYWEQTALDPEIFIK